MNERALRVVYEYRAAAKELLLALGRAARDYADEHPELDLSHEGTLNPPAGPAIEREPSLTVRRDVSGGRWVDVVGFALRPVADNKHIPAGRIDLAIDLDVADRRPPLKIPVTAYWAAEDSYGRSRPDGIEPEPIILEPGRDVRLEIRS